MVRLLVVIFAWLAFSDMVLAVDKVTIVRGGKAACAIIVKKEARAQRLSAAQELQHWLEQVTGAKLGIETTPPATKGIFLGTAADFPDQARRERLEELGPEGIIVKSDGKRLWILANTDLGLSEAVYTFLDHIGCRWFFPDPVWTVIPRRSDLSVSVDLRTQPPFGYRRIWYGWGPRTPKLRKDYNAWLRHNRQLGHFSTDCGHAYERYISRREFKQHPDWFALVNGKRKPTQLCTSNPEVQRRVVERVLQCFRRDPKRNMASIEPNDGGGYCECEKCKALGTISDRVFFLANVVARAVRKEFPDKWVGLYAYASHSEPPHFKLEPGVYVQVTTGFRYTKMSFDEQVAAFRKLGAKVGVYDYFSVYPWDWDLPGAAKAGRVYQLAQAIRHYSDLGLTTYDAESSCNWGPNGPGYWLASKLMWDTTLDPHALMDDFCLGAFARAARPMRRVYERWWRGERFSPRGLKLALLDLREAYELEKDPAVRARLDRLAMYLHWLRLWTDYNRSSRWNQWGKLVVAPTDEIIARAKAVTVYARRIMDTGMIHTYPLIFSSWYARRFEALKKIKGFDIKRTEAWKKERTDIPSSEEIAKDFADDLRRFDKLTAVEIDGRTFGGELVPLRQVLPEAVKAWGDVKRSPLFVETGVHYFVGKTGERLELTYTPFDAGHTVDCHWTLRRFGAATVLAEGDVKAPKGKPATVEIETPENGLLAFDPGTGYWKAAQIEFGPRPLSVWAGRADVPGHPKHTPFRLWLPRNEPLYFFVPKGTKHFVIGIVSGGDPYTDLQLKTADGTVVLKDRLLAGDEVSVIVERDVREYGAKSAMAKGGVLPGDQTSVVVPKGKDGQVWSLSLSSLRCVVELYDVPPYIARHPAELLVPKDAVK